MQKESQWLADPIGKPPKPLPWVSYGGPGVGESHVLKMFIRDIVGATLGWSLGTAYQDAALQVVMAEQLGGDTIHRAVGNPDLRPP